MKKIFIKKSMKSNKNLQKDYRYEKKFVLQGIELKKIEEIIKNNPSMFKEIYYERQINNIYLDTLDLRNYYENVFGHSERIKIRIRWYGKMFGLVKNPVLEFKIKKNKLGEKKSFKLKNFILDEKFDYPALKKVFAESSLPSEVVETLKRVFPSLLSSYKRRYFISSDKSSRITLDYHMEFFKINKRVNLFVNKTKNNKIILELKVPYEKFEKAREITQHFPFRLSANSKYVSGIDLLS